MVISAPGQRIAAAYRTCAAFARAHYENFPVASRLLPADMRPHVAAVYAFARVADDFADEGDLSAEQRLALLDDWLTRLRQAGGGAGPRGQVAKNTGIQDLTPPETDDIFLALGCTIRDRALPLTLFEDLLSAFRQDVTTRRYETWGDVLDYCRRSANPVGRLVLAIAGPVADERANRASDALCTALQLTNFWQDLERDWQKGRLYLPLEECRGEGVDFADLERRVLGLPWRRVLESAAARTDALFLEGRPVCDAVRGRLRLELRFTWLGGRRILERLGRQAYDVFSGRPTLGAGDVPILLWRALAWRGRAEAAAAIAGER
jgi:squalene synthase HpnC